MGLKLVYSCMILLLGTKMCHGQCLSENDDAKDLDHVDLSNITGFGLELFKEIFPYNTSQNFFFSPYSIWNVLVLAYFGSEGNTQNQLESVLRIKNKVQAMNNWRKLSYMYELRQKKNTDYTFRLANRAYFDETVKVKPCLKDLLKDDIRNLDFGQPGAASQKINAFVSETTKGRIKDIVSPQDIKNSRMALVNAAFFKGTWLTQFKKSKTKKGLFYATEQDYYFVQMMRQKGRFRSGPSEKMGAYLLELPYTGQEISMIILLPPFSAHEEGFNFMVQNLDADVLHEEISQLILDEVDVIIPKFKLKEKIGDELISALKKMGVRDLFDPLTANLTSFDPMGHLNVDKSIHKAFVEVNEEGTEAAAATALIQFRNARPLEPYKFECNHPFLFVLFDKVTKNILFLGAYKNPKKM